jgi:FkbM family methyltransferase
MSEPISGLISLFASKITGPDGHVLSFEPSPDVLALLYRNTEGEKNIKVLPYGIGNADTVTSFAAQGTSSSATPSKPHGETIENLPVAWLLCKHGDERSWHD